MKMAVDKDTNTVTSMKDMMQSMAENSSIHGVSRWVTSRYWYQRVLWVLVFLGATGGMSYQLSLLFQSFQSYPVKTSVDLKFSVLPFPAVSLCNMNPIRMSKLSLTSRDTQNVMNGTSGGYAGRKKRSLKDKSKQIDDRTLKWSNPASESSQEDLVDKLVSSKLPRRRQKLESSKPDLQRRPAHVSYNRYVNHHKNAHAPLSWLHTLFALRSLKTMAGEGEHKDVKFNHVRRQKRSHETGDLLSDATGGSGSGNSSSGDDTRSGSGTRFDTSTYNPSGDGSGYFSADGSWSYYQDYRDEMENYVIDEWTERVSQFHAEFLKNPSETRKKVGHSIRDMLISCAFNGKECYENNLTLFQSLEYGNCYTFQDSSYITKRSGPLLGLRLTLNIETKEYVSDYMDAFGLRLVIHEPGTFPFPEEEGFTLNPMYETTIGMRLVSIKRASEPHGKCESGEEFKKLFGIEYTIPACLKLCRQREIISRCKCIPSEFYIDVGLADDELQLCSNSTEKIDCEEFLLFKLENNLINCNCRSPCRQKVYSTSLSGRLWPSKKFLTEHILRDICGNTDVNWYFQSDCYLLKNQISIDEASLARISKNFLKVVIYFEDLNYEEIKEEPMYDGFQFVSDIGGALGLFMGASILSFVEVFQFILEILNLLRSKIFVKRETTVIPVTEMMFYQRN